MDVWCARVYVGWLCSLGSSSQRVDDLLIKKTHLFRWGIWRSPRACFSHEINPLSSPLYTTNNAHMVQQPLRKLRASIIRKTHLTEVWEILLCRSPLSGCARYSGEAGSSRRFQCLKWEQSVNYCCRAKWISPLFAFFANKTWVCLSRLCLPFFDTNFSSNILNCKFVSLSWGENFPLREQQIMWRWKKFVHVIMNTSCFWITVRLWVPQKTHPAFWKRSHPVNCFSNSRWNVSWTVPFFFHVSIRSGWLRQKFQIRRLFQMILKSQILNIIIHRFENILSFFEPPKHNDDEFKIQWTGKYVSSFKTLMIIKLMIVLDNILIISWVFN